jgi:hypothetical protein
VFVDDIGKLPSGEKRFCARRECGGYDTSGKTELHVLKIQCLPDGKETRELYVCPAGSMTDNAAFFEVLWKRLRPHALSAAVEFGQYLFLWAGVLGVHFIKIIAQAAGVESDIIDPVSFMERWMWIASFAAFFWRVLIRVWRASKGG